MWMLVEYTDAGAALYRTTTPDVAARAKMSCGTAEIMMWVWTIGAFYLAAVVNQIAIGQCRRAQTATEPDLHEQWSPEP
jgi:hypothetical protein